LSISALFVVIGHRRVNTHQRENSHNKYLHKAGFVVGRSGDNAFCYHCPPAEWRAGLCETPCQSGLGFMVMVGSRIRVVGYASLYQLHRHFADIGGVSVSAGKSSGYGVFGNFNTYEAVGF